MSSHEQANPYRISKERLETMVDAIFAFAMTLLVLGIQTPSFSAGQASSELPGYIGHLVPQVILFIIAFLVLALFWLEHHRQFYYVRLANPIILWLNTAILIFIVLIPFTTDVSGDYGGIQIAVLLFHVNFLAIGTLFLTQWVYLSRSCHLCIEELSPTIAAKRLWFLVLIPGCAIIGIVVSFFSPSYSLAGYLLIPVFTVIHRIYLRNENERHNVIKEAKKQQ